MKLIDWAVQQGVTYTTAYRWFKKDLIPGAKQLPTGTILVDDITAVQLVPRTVIYCRVSSATKKADLERQVQRCLDYCAAKGLSVDKVYKEVASGMNDNRTMFWKMLDSKPTTVVIEHKDRLTRFGFNYIERLLKPSCSIDVINRDHTDESDLLKDLTSVITSFCCRLYGMRRGINKAEELKNGLKD